MKIYDKKKKKSLAWTREQNRKQMKPDQSGLEDQREISWG